MKKRTVRSLLVFAAIGSIAVAAVLQRSSPGPESAKARAAGAGLYSSAGPLSAAQIARLAGLPRSADAAAASKTIVSKGSGTIGPSPDPSSQSWHGDDVDASTSGGSVAECNASGARCDDFLLTVDTAQPRGTFTVNVNIDLPAEDYDLYVYDNAGNEVGNSGNPNGVPETTTIPCPSLANGPYTVRVVYFTTSADIGNSYHATATWADGSCPGPTNPSYVNNALTFAPGTLVSAHWIAGEPQTTLERTNAPWSDPAHTNDNRIFVDWPISSRSNIGQLSRSLDGGDSFRLLFDPTCSARSRPNCATGGGGDTEEDVNLKNGDVFFGDQESLANEASATSTDHGDSFLSQTPLGSSGSGTDREWIAATDDSQKLAGVGPNIEAFFTYHIPPNAFIHAIPDTTHVPVSQAGPQITNAGQTGQPRVDNNPSSPGYGWIYYPYRDFIGAGPLQAGTSVATAPSTGYQLVSNWHTHVVTGDGANSFPWVAIDSAGNAYVSWDPGGVVYYAYSLISDPLNNPSVGGIPGTVWSQKIRITPPGLVGSGVFPEITAGSVPGRIGVTYVGSEDYSGDPNGSDPTAHWKTYAAVINNANTDSPTIYTGVVSHRIVHHGNICTHGTTCGLPGVGNDTDDRSFLDMIDVGFDNNGRLGVVYEDNNTHSFQDDATTNPGGSAMVDQETFMYFAKEVTGQTLFPNTSPVNISIPRGARDDPAGDATWPNTAAGTNIPALDVLHTSLDLVGPNLVAHLKLADASTSAMTGAITAYNNTLCAPPPCNAQRLQYVVRFNSANEAYHMSLEVQPDGTMRAYGGKLDANDGIPNPASPTAIIAAGYMTDAGFTVTPTITPGPGGEIVLSAPASQFGLAGGDDLYSATGFAMAGPNEIDPTTHLAIPQTAAYVMRTVDASPPFDTTLGTVTAVTVRSFAAQRSRGAVVIRWRTATEVETLGFNLYRRQNGRLAKLNRGLIPAAGGVGGHAYAWRDRRPGRSPRYTLDEIRRDGSSVLRGPISPRLG